MLIVDRTVHGPYENYQTPEQRIPDHKIDNPWESCITLGNAWGYVPGDKFKSASEVISKLIEIVAKGGSLLLGVGPSPDGTLPQPIIDRLEEIGQWMKYNGAAIYNTRCADIYQDGKVFFTQTRDGNAMFALIPESDDAPLSTTVEWTGNIPAKNSRITLLQTGQKLKWSLVDGTVKVRLPKQLKPAPIALSFTVRK